MRPSDISLKFAIAIALIAGGVVPIAMTFGNVSNVILGLEQHGRSWPAAFAANTQGFGTASFIILACVLSFAAGVTLAVVAFGRTLDYVHASSGRRPRALRY